MGKKTPLEFMEKTLKDAEINLAKAKHRVKTAQDKQREKRLKNPKYNKPDIPDRNSEIEKLEEKIEICKYIIEAVNEKMEKEKQQKGL